MNTDIFTNIVQLALTCGIGVVAFFLKRTISELDECKQNISDMKADYITREDFFREQDNTRRQLDKIMSVLLEIKGDSKQ